MAIGAGRLPALDRVPAPVWYTRCQQASETPPRPGWMRGKRVTDHHHTGNGGGIAADEDGQIESQGNHVPPRSAGARPRMKPAAAGATLTNNDAGSVSAVQVSMERSGAEHIEAQRVTLDHSGAKSLKTGSAELINSGTVTLSATNATLSQSSALLAQVKDLRLEHSKVLIAQSGKTSIAGSGRIGILQTGSVEAEGDVNGLLIMSGGVRAGGDVNVTFDAVSAGVLGAAFAGMLFLLRRVFSRS